MDKAQLLDLLRAVQRGETAPEAAAEQLRRERIYLK